ncbi:discoidin domain-containing protein [Streptomyces sp. NPDC054863]
MGAVFPGTESLAPLDPVLRGGMSAVWNDLVHATYAEKDVHGLVEQTFGVLAQKMWSGAGAGVPYAAFTASMRRGALGPGLKVVGPTLAEPDRISFGATASASSCASGTQPGAAADGSPVTRWSSRPEHEPWLAVDLGRVRGVGRVRLDRGQEYGRAYDIEVSRDGKAWVKVAERRGRGAAGRDELPFGAVDARYVRVHGRERRPARYTLWSVQVFDVPDLARGKATTASSVEAEHLGAALATDGDPGTRRASAYTDGEWISVDLGPCGASGGFSSTGRRRPARTTTFRCRATGRRGRPSSGVVGPLRGRIPSSFPSPCRPGTYGCRDAGGSRPTGTRCGGSKSEGEGQPCCAKWQLKS